MSHSNQQTHLRQLVLTALFASAITVMTAYILHIPIPTGGYIHLGDALIYLAACLLPAPYAAAAAAQGGGNGHPATPPQWGGARPGEILFSLFFQRVEQLQGGDLLVRRFPVGLGGRLELTAQDGHLPGGLDGQTDPACLHGQDGDLHLLPDEQGLALFSLEDQHGAASSRCPNSDSRWCILYPWSSRMTCMAWRVSSLTATGQRRFTVLSDTGLRTTQRV